MLIERLEEEVDVADEVVVDEKAAALFDNLSSSISCRNTLSLSTFICSPISNKLELAWKTRRRESTSPGSSECCLSKDANTDNISLGCACCLALWGSEGSMIIPEDLPELLAMGVRRGERLIVSSMSSLYLRASSSPPPSPPPPWLSSEM